MLSAFDNNIILSKIAFITKKIKLGETKTHLIVSRKVFRSVISSGIRLKILLRDADFLLSSWKASSLLLSLYSITKLKKQNCSFLIRLT